MVPMFVPVISQQGNQVTAPLSDSTNTIINQSNAVQDDDDKDRTGAAQGLSNSNTKSDISLSSTYVNEPLVSTSPLMTAAEHQLRLEEQQSSTDTTASSPIFASHNESSSAGSVTEDEKDDFDQGKGALFTEQLDLSASPPNTEETAMEGEEGKTSVQPAPAATRTLTTKRSFWNLLRSSTAATSAEVTVALPPSQPTKEEEEQEQRVSEIQTKVSEKSALVLRKRTSFSPFPNLNVVGWSKASRRHTVTAVEPAEDLALSGTFGLERSLDGSIHLPQHDVDEIKVAEDAIRFADARHVIKVAQDIETIRDFAQRLEQGWREKQREVTQLQAKLEEVQLYLHDIRDENKHLRGQLGGMSEQIVARDHDFEELQKLTVEQSKKEREIWEVEKRQALEVVEGQLKEATSKLALYQTMQGMDLSDADLNHEDHEDLDLLLFSATTSIDSELQTQQGKETLLLVPLTTPTTPTLQVGGYKDWPIHSLRGGITDPLQKRLEQLAAKQGKTAVV